MVSRQSHWPGKERNDEIGKKAHSVFLESSNDITTERRPVLVCGVPHSKEQSSKVVRTTERRHQARRSIHAQIVVGSWLDRNR